jgi:hypothetical protein
MNFLKKRDDRDYSAKKVGPTVKKKTAKELRDEEISAYFRRPVDECGHVHQNLDPKRSSKHPDMRSEVGAGDQPLLKSVEHAASGSRAPQREVSGSRGLYGSCYTWSESIALPRQSSANRRRLPLPESHGNSSHLPREAQETGPKGFKKAEREKLAETCQPNSRTHLAPSQRIAGVASSHVLSQSQMHCGATKSPDLEVDQYHTSDILELRDRWRIRLPQSIGNENKDEIPVRESAKSLTSTPTSKDLRDAFYALAKSHQDHWVHSSEGRRTKSDQRRSRTDDDSHDGPNFDPPEYVNEIEEAAVQYEPSWQMPQRGFSRISRGVESYERLPLPSLKLNSRYEMLHLDSIAGGDSFPGLGHATTASAPREPYVYTNSRQVEDLVRRLNPEQDEELYGPHSRESERQGMETRVEGDSMMGTPVIDVSSSAHVQLDMDQRSGGRGSSAFGSGLELGTGFWRRNLLY